jgi:hypothetical protein
MDHQPSCAEHRLRIEQFISLFRESVYFRPVQAVLSETECFFAQRVPGQALRFWVAPSEMLCGPPDAEGDAPWQPIDSPIDEATVGAFERFLGATLPPLFKAYLTYKCLLYIDLYEGTLPDIDPRHPLGWLEWCAVRRKQLSFASAPWLIPFTEGPAGCGLLCFDTRRPDEHGDCPIIFVKDTHDAESDHVVGQGTLDRQVFNSFASYLEFLEDWLIFKSTPRDVLFSTWLEQSGKAVPQEYYDAIGS